VPPRSHVTVSSYNPLSSLKPVQAPLFIEEVPA
jgi:hypothetical protein